MSDPRAKRSRNAEIMNRRDDGESYTVLALSYGITDSRVRQIYENMKRKERNAIRLGAAATRIVSGTPEHVYYETWGVHARPNLETRFAKSQSDAAKALRMRRHLRERLETA